MHEDFESDDQFCTGMGWICKHLLVPFQLFRNVLGKQMDTYNKAHGIRYPLTGQDS